MTAPIFEFILENFNNTSRENIVRCLNKATIIIFDNINVLVADEEYVYYFGSRAAPLNTVKFYYRFKHLISGKKSYTWNKKIIKVMAKETIQKMPDGKIEYLIK